MNRNAQETPVPGETVEATEEGHHRIGYHLRDRRRARAAKVVVAAAMSLFGQVFPLRIRRQKVPWSG